MHGLEGFRFCIFIAGLVLFALLESWCPERRWLSPRPKRWGFHGSIAGANALIVRAGASAPFWIWAAFVAKHEWGVLPWLGVTGSLEIVSAAILLDLLNYLWHRLNHEWGFLWRFHQTHHTDDHVDTSTSLRFHPGELVLSWIVKGSWVFLVGPSLYAFFAFESLVSLAAQFHHSNWRLGRSVDEALRLVTVSPLYHAAHHTKAARSRNGNYATILTVLDRLFGTFRSPESENLEDLGLPGPQRPLSATEFLLKPFRALEP